MCPTRCCGRLGSRAVRGWPIWLELGGLAGETGAPMAGVLDQVAMALRRDEALQRTVAVGAGRTESDREGDGRPARSAASAWAICWVVDRSSSWSRGRSAGGVCSAECCSRRSACSGSIASPGSPRRPESWSPSCTCWRPRSSPGPGPRSPSPGRRRWSFAPDRRRLARLRGWRSRFEAGRTAEVPLGLRVGLGIAAGLAALALLLERVGWVGLAGGGRGRRGRTGVPEPTRVRSGQEVPPGSGVADAAGARPAGRDPDGGAAAPAGHRGGGASVSRAGGGHPRRRAATDRPRRL